MNQARPRLLVRAIFILFCIATFLAPAKGDDGLKTIKNPGGGQVIYGPLDDASSLKDAMIFMLKNIRGHFGDRPQIGKIFQTPDHESIATFFTLTAKTQ